MKNLILLAFTLYLIPTSVWADSAHPIKNPSHSQKAFLDPQTGTWTSEHPTVNITPRTAEIPDTSREINSPVPGGGKMISVEGLFNHDLKIYRSHEKWQTKCQIHPSFANH